MSGVIAHELAPLAEDFARENLEPSEATGALLRELYGVAEAAARQGLVAIIEGDESAAQQVVAQRDPFWRLGGQLLRQQAAQLAGDDPARLVKHRLQVDVLDKLRRIYSLAEHMAVSVLPRGALTAERGGRAVAT